MWYRTQICLTVGPQHPTGDINEVEEIGTVLYVLRRQRRGGWGRENRIKIGLLNLAN